MAIDFEIKIFCVLSVFAACKFTGIASHWLAEYLARAVFIFVHVLIVVILKRALETLDMSNMSGGNKKEVKEDLQNLRRNTLIRAFVIFGIHLHTKMLPPLIGSSIINLLGLIEDPHCKAELQLKKEKEKMA
jgi:hypothetical protein